MFLCPKCGGSMIWIGDNETVEGIAYSDFDCMTEGCHVEMTDHWGRSYKNRREVIEVELTEYEKGLMNEWVATVEFVKVMEKTTIAMIKLTNGFEIIGTSACVDPAAYDREIGEFYALRDALNKLDELVAFKRT